MTIIGVRIANIANSQLPSTNTMTVPKTIGASSITTLNGVLGAALSGATGRLISSGGPGDTARGGHHRVLA